MGLTELTFASHGIMVGGLPPHAAAGISTPQPRALRRSLDGAFFVPAVSWWAVWGRLRARRLLVGGSANPARSATYSRLAPAGGGSSYAHEDLAMRDNVYPFPSSRARPSREQRFQESVARLFATATPKSEKQSPIEESLVTRLERAVTRLEQLIQLENVK